jgi:hypothetical protein
MPSFHRTTTAIYGRAPIKSSAWMSLGKDVRVTDLMKYRSDLNVDKKNAFIYSRRAMTPQKSKHDQSATAFHWLKKAAYVFT